MKEDLAIARNSLMALQAENLAMRQKHTANHLGSATDSHNKLNDGDVHEQIDPEMAEALADERKKKYELEKELELQVIFLQMNQSTPIFRPAYTNFHRGLCFFGADFVKG